MVNRDCKFTRTVEDGLNPSGTLCSWVLLSLGNMYSEEDKAKGRSKGMGEDVLTTSTAGKGKGVVWGEEENLEE